MKYKQNQNKIDIIKKQCLKELSDLGIYVHNNSVTTSSCYLKFHDERLKSLTIRDHKTIPKYKYKWNIIIGYTGETIVIDKHVKRYIYSDTELGAFFKHIRNYHKKIKENNND